MAVIKCKMCGGDLFLMEGQSVAECEYCGSKQTVPAADNEKKLIQFERAERLRKNCEFDKAAGLYEAIVSDFRQESEAYWGLVLCKYGIEYVDDPATGKKIPTCHRSSFDSVMDDSNFEQAMENADELALRVYRQEAKQIETIRKGILEVSSSEKPYDIFICYKETDSNGDRTVDSLLAQDIYDALVSKGYRVFFSRITLEDKLGQAYEPYIFAALNSAKIMLAVGTCYEHYNAVWVKNEWRRYLKIVAQDKSKYLIPCYKGLDAYDMPKEFAHLQGQDMGKVGAIADLLRGIEKLIPCQKSNTVIVQEKVVVGNVGGSNKIASLLDRGNMALEDGDWAKADSFFEDVLNNDSKNAQAYIGKTLAQERCRTMDALVRKRKDVYQNVSSEKLYIGEKSAYINEMAEQYSLPGYVDPNAIRDLYRFDLSYTSEVSGRQKQYHEEELWWQNHRWLSRAEKFAVGAVAEHLQNEKKHLFAQLADRVQKAQESDARSVAKLEAVYDAHIAEVDKQAEKLYNDGLARREKDYENWLEQAKKETSPDKLRKLADNFVSLRAYKDSKNLAEHCRNRAADEQGKIDAEKERQQVIAEQKKKVQQKRMKTVAVIAAACVVLVVAAVLVVTRVVIPSGKYNDAVALMNAGRYEEAIVAFEAIGGYKESVQKITDCELAIIEEQYAEAIVLMASGEYSEAIIALEKIAGYKDSDELIKDSWNAIEELRLKAQYDAAAALAKSGETAKAAIAFYKLENYKDSKARCFSLWDAAIKNETISAGHMHTVGVKKDGTVVAVGKTEKGQCDVKSWTNIVSVSAGYDFTVGLKADGRVVAVGDNSYDQLNVDQWTGIVAVGAGYGHTVGLRADGTVVAVGWNANNQCDVSDWKDIVAISVGNTHTVGLKADGTVLCAASEGDGCTSADGIKDAIGISASDRLTVVLKSDGQVFKYGSMAKPEVNTGGWEQVVFVDVGYHHIVGITDNGDAIAYGDNYCGQCNITGWKNMVFISAGAYHTVGIQADGTVLTTESSDGDEKNSVSGWKDIKLPN